MNKKTRELIELDKRYLWHPFTQMDGWLGSDPVVIERGEGFELVDTEGRRYIDGVSSLWCNIHGHCVSQIDDAIRTQLDQIAHSTLLGLGQSRSIELAERLIKIAPAGLARVFYSDSGATAVEIALKIAYQYWHNLGQKERGKFISLREAYHGDTVGAVSVSGMELFGSIYKPLLFETLYVHSPHPYRFDGPSDKCAQYSLENLESLLKAHAGQVAAIITEPLVQGAAGMIVHPKGFLKSVEQLARQYDVLLIVDEVATGFGRTGKMFACEHQDVHPDLMCVAKGISGGYLPLAATLATQKIFDAFLGRVEDFKTFYHGHTYTGNALACAAGLASLELFGKKNILKKMPDKTDLMCIALGEILTLPFVGDVRQCGMMAGIELVKNKKTKESFECRHVIGAKVCAAMRPKGLMLRPLGDVIVLMPAPAMDNPTLTKLLAVVSDTIEKDLPGIVKAIS
jgi:adenosylmethionine-8-amino-7-oxononanoate aminotransferase